MNITVRQYEHYKRNKIMTIYYIAMIVVAFMFYMISRYSLALAFIYVFVMNFTVRKVAIKYIDRMKES